MGHYEIIGGKKLAGELMINGGKNAVLPIMAAALLNAGESILHHCPGISDLTVAENILIQIGCHIKREKDTLLISSKDAYQTIIHDGLVHQMRSSIIFLGALLGRFHTASLAYPGGCEIGARPIDLHLKAMRKLGAVIEEKNGFLHCSAKKLIGTQINLDFPSVGATENIMLAATMAEGETTIYNAAMEPELVDLQEFLNKMGANVSGAGTDTIIIKGVPSLHDVEHTIMPDRIEAGTYLCAAAITGGEITLHRVRPDDIRQILLRFTQMGCAIQEDTNTLYLKAPRVLKPIDLLRTQPYPGFPTDMQPQFMSLLTLAKGTSIIVETVFESRFKHILELCHMGADITFEGRTAVIKGVCSLKGDYVISCDLRGGAALILAGLAAEGKTIVQNSCFVERGYEQIEKRLTSLGAKIDLF